MSNIPDNNRLEPNPCSVSPPESLQVEIICYDGIDCPLEAAEIRSAAIAAAEYRGCSNGQLGIRVTDDPRIHQINRDHLGHDDPTDVISFGYRLQPPWVEGELVVSAETARREASRLGWQAGNELMLYVVHGTLHITGMGDAQPAERAEMRRAERAVLRRLAINDFERFGVEVDDKSSTQSASDREDLA